MLTNAILFERELISLINEEIERLKELLTTTPVDYQGNGSIPHTQGAIIALRGMEELIAEAKKRSDQYSR